MNDHAPILSIIAPCYNEHETLPQSLPVLLALLSEMAAEGLVSPKSYLLCVDDGSTDNTWELICQANAADGRVRGVSFAHNRGQQPAMLAGMQTSIDHQADCMVTIDVDLQDDPRAIVEMVRLYRQGAEIVFGVRASRQSDTWFKRNSARAFYRLQEVMGVPTIYDHSEFRLLSRRAAEMLLQYGESNMFMRGLIIQLGLKTATVTFDRSARAAGETHYSVGKLINLSIDGITSFSSKPMRFIFYVGCLLLLADVFVAIYVLASMRAHVNISGWASIMLSIWFLGSLILMAIGIVGEYIGKIYIEVKHRPRYYISSTIGL